MGPLGRVSPPCCEDIRGIAATTWLGDKADILMYNLPRENNTSEPKRRRPVHAYAPERDHERPPSNSSAIFMTALYKKGLIFFVDGDYPSLMLFHGHVLSSTF